MLNHSHMILGVYEWDINSNCRVLQSYTFSLRVILDCVTCNTSLCHVLYVTHVCPIVMVCNCNNYEVHTIII